MCLHTSLFPLLKALFFLIRFHFNVSFKPSFAAGSSRQAFGGQQNPHRSSNSLCQTVSIVSIKTENKNTGSGLKASLYSLLSILLLLGLHQQLWT